MGVNLVLPVSPNSTGGFNIGTSAGVEDAALDFASLFTSQLLGGLPLAGQTTGNAPGTPDGEQLADDSTETDETPLDASLALLAPYLPIAQAPTGDSRQGADTPTDDDTQAAADASLLGELAAAAQAGAAQGVPAAPAADTVHLGKDDALTATLGRHPSTVPGTELKAASANDSAPTANLAADNATPAETTRPFGETLAAVAGNAPTTHHHPANAEAATSTVKTHIGEPLWKNEFSERIVWQAKSDIQSAQININPPQLGPVQISLNLNGDQASAVFTSPHAEVRQAIEDALPKLREMLSASGINLGDANVGSQQSQQQREAAAQFAGASRSTGETAILSGDSQSGTVGVSAPLQRGRGLVDLFA